MVSEETLLAAVRHVLGNDGLAPHRPVDDFAVDGLLPRLVVSPRTVEEVSAVTRALSEQRAAIIPWGGGSAMGLGNIPARYDVALSLTHLNRVLEYEPSDLTVTVEAGITLRELQVQLGQHGQYLPYDPPYADRATIGGILAVGLAGPLRYTYGSVVDRALGVRMVHADGRVSKAGGKVVKNVAGYEMTKLYVGSLGTLGIFVEATFKVAPLPRVTRTVLAYLASANDALGLAFAVRDLGLSARAVELVAGASQTLPFHKAGSYLIAIDLAGSAAGVDRSLAELERLVRECEAQDMVHIDGAAEQEGVWQVLRDLGGPSTNDSDLVVKINVLPTQVAGLIDSLLLADANAGLSAETVLSHVLLGTVYVWWHGINDTGSIDNARQMLSRLRTDVAGLGGTVLVMSCPLTLKSQIDVWGELRGDFPLMQQIKRQMDPDGILNPGRFMGRL